MSIMMRSYRPTNDIIIILSPDSFKFIQFTYKQCMCPHLSSLHSPFLPLSNVEVRVSKEASHRMSHAIEVISLLPLPLVDGTLEGVVVCACCAC